MKDCDMLVMKHGTHIGNTQRHARINVQYASRQ